MKKKNVQTRAYAFTTLIDTFSLNASAEESAICENKNVTRLTEQGKKESERMNRRGTGEEQEGSSPGIIHDTCLELLHQINYNV